MKNNCRDGERDGRREKDAGETDKTDREAERDTEMPVVHRQAAQDLRDVHCSLCTPVMHFMYYRYDVKQTSDVFVLFLAAWFPNGKMIH